jgi:hypothetical protein
LKADFPKDESMRISHEAIGDVNWFVCDARFALFGLVPAVVTVG